MTSPMAEDFPEPMTIDEIKTATNAATNQRHRVHWMNIARAVRALEAASGSPTDANQVRWSDLVAAAAKLGGTQIVTMLRAYNLLEQLAATGEIDSVGEFDDLTVDAVDTINRYIAIDRSAAITELKKHPNSREIKQRYTEVLTARKTSHDRSQHVGRLLQKDFRLRCQAIFALNHRLESRTPDASAAADTPLRPTRHVDLDAIHTDPHGRITSMQARKFSSVAARRSYRAYLHQALFEATFVDCFWIYIDDSDIAQQLMLDLDELSAANIGVVLIPAVMDDEYPYDHKVLREATGGPTPDRRRLLLQPTSTSAAT